MSIGAQKSTPATVRYAAGESATRPWGRWEVIAVGDQYTVKRITVLPRQRLSLQYHHHRSEHWTVVEGHAEVEIEGMLRQLGFGEHVYIPVGAKHRVRNGGHAPLVFIEVQIGDLLDENDIVRLSDDYGRLSP
jgi:mannose-6-phosphate isomerase-like protein (cupin superfamily)